MLNLAMAGDRLRVGGNKLNEVARNVVDEIVIVCNCLCFTRKYTSNIGASVCSDEELGVPFKFLGLN